ncbi:MAG: EAL domain-containing protein [Snowella sp.]
MLSKFSSLLNQFRLSSSQENSRQHQNWGQHYYWQSVWVIAFLSVLMTGAIGWAKQQGRLQFLELLVYDYLVQLQPKQPIDSRLLVVGITEEDIANQKRWPLSDETIAQLLINLEKFQPKVIALDLFRDIPHPPGQEALEKVLASDNVIVANQLPSSSDDPGVSAPPRIPRERIGFVDLVIDPDNVVRRGLLGVGSSSGKRHFPSFALQTSLKYLADPKLALKFTPHSLTLGQMHINRLQADSGGYQLPASEVAGWQTLLRFRSPSIARQVSLTDVLNQKIDPQWIKGKIVLIGVTAPSVKDTFPTPYSSVQTSGFEMPGVIIHSHLVSQILDLASGKQRQFWFWNLGEEWVWLGLWSVVGGVLTWRMKQLRHFILSLAIAVAGLWFVCWWLFLQGGWIPFVPPLLGLFFTAVFTLAYKVVYQNYHDSLTGLPNRRLFLQRIEAFYHQHSHAKSAFMAVLFLDLDRFKLVNDGLGHLAGDALLFQTAQRLKSCLNIEHLLARVGGDEFAVWLPNLKDSKEAIALADLFQKELTEPFFWKGKEICITVSIGIAFNQYDSDSEPPELLRYADIAMFHAKAMGKARHEIFMKGMDTKAIVRWQLETDLRLALSQDEFEVYYQPIVNLQSLRIEGFEALVRWRSPSRGLISPDNFISVAEESGLIVPLGHWILRQACQQIQLWRQQFPNLSNLQVSVNLSGRQFSQPNLVEQIRAVLMELNLTGDELKLEITESMIIHNVEDAIALLHELKSLGLKLSIDDFGTGYSSLSYLHRFPVDTLKIDKSFVSRLIGEQEQEKYTQLVHTIITLGHNLKMTVIAEGLETEEQLKILQSFHCEYGQGYFFAKPLLRDDATELLVHHVQGENPPPFT